MDVLALLETVRSGEPGGDPCMPAPDWLGRRMAALYSRWDRRARFDLVALTVGFLDRLGMADAPIGRACVQVAGAVADWKGHPYHSTQHHAEVATNAMVLTEVAGRFGQPVPRHQRAILLAGSLAHDIDYEPVRSPQTRFVAEARSARTMDVINIRCGLDQADREALRCLILATEPAFRARLTLLLSRPGSRSGVPRRLHPLVAQPALAELAAILSDADLLSSSGLTLRWHQVQLARLERELGRRIPAAEDLRFFEQVVGDNFLSPGGRHFLPNLARIRRAVQTAATLGNPDPTLPAN
jgi:hypothetical protein